jgi:pimeloyl-ACP methyl ester carboxylesterase
MPDQQLDQAIELVKSGKIEQARVLLEQVIKDNRNNITAWEWYVQTWSKPKDKIRVWELCLRHNPGNPKAQQALEFLNSDRHSTDTQPKAETTSYASSFDTEKSRSSQWLLWASIGLFIVLAGLVVLVVRLSSPKDPADYRHIQPVEYYLYVPKAYSADKEWPLFVGIHGAGGTGLDCWNLWQSYADKEGFILLCPSIPGDSSGFYQDVGERTVWSAIGEVKKEYRVKKRMFFNGFSAGAFFIQGFTYHYPQYVSGLSILSAGVYLNPNMFAELVPILVVIGDSDDPTAVATSQMFVDNLKQFGFDVQYEVMPGVGHTVTRRGMSLTIDLFRKTIGK